MDRTPVDLVHEAESIVNVYSTENDQKKQNAEFDVLLNVIMALSCTTLAVVLAMVLL